MATQILIIEDNEENLNLMSYLLRMHGYEVLQSRDGEHALYMGKCEKFDLVLCDIQIPKIDGYEVISRFKSKSSPLRDIPIVAITAYAMVGDREKILKSGCDGYIPKPIDPESFVSQIERYLPPQKRVARLNVAQLEHPEQLEHTSNGQIRGSFLLVDDNPSDRYLSEMLLKSMGFEVASAINVDQAFEMLSNSKPDFILSDYHLPNMNGLEFFSALKNNTEFSHIPFVLISSSILQEQRTNIFKKADSIEAIIIRPVEPQVFIEIIERVWQKMQPGSSSINPGRA
jgi:two-component system cell cycle response regulator